MDASQFESHDLWQAVDHVKALTGQAEGVISPDQGPVLDRLRYVVAAIDGHRTPTTTEPYARTMLDKMLSHLGQFAAELSNFTTNENPQHLTNADSHADQALYQFGLWPTSVLKSGAAQSAIKTFTEYEELSAAANQTLRDRNAELVAEIESQQSEEAERKSKADQALQELQASVEQLRTKIADDETRLNQALTANNETFTSSQTSRDTTFSEWLNQQADSLKKLAAADLEAIGTLKSEAQTAHDEVDGLRTDTQVVAGLAAGDQVARGYSLYAGRERIWGLLIYAIGFAALLGGGFFVSEALKDIGPDDSISWEFTTLKLGITFTAIAAAVVAFRLGAHLLAQAAIAKRFELELKALGPLFAGDHEREQLSEAKSKFVDRSFGHSWGASNRSNEIQVQSTLEKIADLLGRIVQRNPQV